MMTKKLRIIMAITMVFAFAMTGISAKVGDVIGSALHTDIVAYINNYAISSYAVNGQSCIVAEDLRNYGFDVSWDNSDRSLSIDRNNHTSVNEQTVEKIGTPGAFFANILETDITVFANGTQIPSYVINGYTMIPMEHLTCFGEVYWVSEERALKLWVGGLHIRSTMQYVTPYVAPMPVCNHHEESDTVYSSSVYITPTGKRYHNSFACAGKNGRAVSKTKAQSSGYTPCRKCVL